MTIASIPRNSRSGPGILARLDLNGHERILDIGCGDGRITAEVARCVPQGIVVGLDSSAEMVAFAQRDSASEDLPNLRFQQGEAQSLDFHEQFDRVISFACLHWVIDHRPVLAGIRRALRPHGRVMLQFGGKGNAAQMTERRGRSHRPAAMGRLFRRLRVPLGLLQSRQSTGPGSTRPGWSPLDWHWFPRT